MKNYAFFCFVFVSSFLQFSLFCFVWFFSFPLVEFFFFFFVNQFFFFSFSAEGGRISHKFMFVARSMS